MSYTFSFNYFGSIITAKPLGNKTLPPVSEIITACCVPITDNKKIIAVNVIGRGIDIPGGHIDAGETALDAVHRETYEEAFIRVYEPILVDVLEVTSSDDSLGFNKKPYMLIYAAKVKEVDDFIVNSEVSERLILSPEAFTSAYFADQNYAKEMIGSAMELVSSR